ncbi:MAG: efflux RND transporter periplasmic adaptor subunit [Planctomycetota bacterium]|nr:efflux RND transporter periplasmic adaptor subunit [Planctomycetota bacterium]
MSVDLNNLRIPHDSASGQGAPRRAGSGTILLFAALGAILGALLVYFFFPRHSGEKQNGHEASSPSSASGIKPGDGKKNFTAGGWIEAPVPYPIEVTPLVEGRVEELRVWEGMRVEQGDVLALLYDQDFKNEVARAEAAVKAWQSQLEKLKAGYRREEVERARAEAAESAAKLDVARKIAERSKGLHEAGAMSKEQLEIAEADANAALARHDAVVQTLKLLEAGSRKEDIDLAAAELAKSEAELTIARTKLGYATVRAPRAGVVLERYVTAGDSVSPARSPLVSLYDPADIQMRVDVNQADIANVFMGQSVEVMTEAEPNRKYSGTVIRIEPLADLAKNTIRVRLKINDPSPALHPEMTATARFVSAGQVENK